MKHGCPYNKLDAPAFWRGSVSANSYADLTPQLPSGLQIDKAMKIASGGSCFAQHIARALQGQGFTYLNSEPGPALLDADARSLMGYGLYSARFGNIYSTPQLAQLIERAYGEFDPKEEPWEENGAWIDPFRPSVQPGGFSSRRRLIDDRAAHLAAVRELFENLDVFVFTMGLTEIWRSREDSAVFPVCPGCSFGEFSSDKYEFANLSVAEVVEGFERFHAKLRQVNSKAKIILTVSPVPLAATNTKRHVVEATNYSKSVLRVAAEELRSRHENIHYFASYEIITNARRNDYFSDDLREVSRLGVAHVMRAFFALFSNEPTENLETNMAAAPPEKSTEQTGDADKVICDEDELFKAQAVRSKST